MEFLRCLSSELGLVDRAIHGQYYIGNDGWETDEGAGFPTNHGEHVGAVGIGGGNKSEHMNGNSTYSGCIGIGSGIFVGSVGMHNGGVDTGAHRANYNDEGINDDCVGARGRHRLKVWRRRRHHGGMNGFRAGREYDQHSGHSAGDGDRFVA